MTVKGGLPNLTGEVDNPVQAWLDAFPVGTAIFDRRMNVLSFNSPMAGGVEKIRLPGVFIWNLIGCSGFSVSDNLSDITRRCKDCPIHSAVVRVFEENLPTWGSQISWPGINSTEGILVRFSILPHPRHKGQEPLAQLIWEEFSPHTTSFDDVSHAQLDAQADKRVAALKRSVEMLQLEISEQRRIEATLRESEKRYRYSIHNSPNPIFAVNRAGHITSWNKACEKMFQYGLDEAIGMPFHLLFEDGRQIEIIEKWVGMVFKGRKFDNLDFTYRGKNGSRFHTISRLYPLKGTSRHPAGCVFANTDVTKRRRNEEALRQSEMELRQFSKRLLELHEYERKKIGETLHDQIFQNLIVLKIGLERQIGSVANPKKVTRDKLADLISMIQESIEQLREIIMTLRPTLIDDLGILATLRWLCQQYQSVHSLFNCSCEMKILEGDIPSSLKIVIFRIAQEAFDNIIQHSRADRVRFVLKKTPHRIIMRIEDNGKGFDPEFVKSDPDSLESVGLSSIKKRIDFTKGTFKIKSAPGQGTTISAHWPLKSNCGI